MYYQDEWGQVFNDGVLVGNVVDTGMSPVIRQGGFNSTNQYTVNDSASALLELAAMHNTMLVGNSLIASGTGDSKQKQDPTYIVNRPWIEQPEGAIPFDPQTSVALPAVGTTSTVVSLTVPDGYDGAIQWYSWNFTGGGFVQGSGDIKVQVLRDGVPVRNYDNITVEKGSIQQPRAISPLRVYSKQVISLTVNHVANNLLNGNVIGSFVGYFYPSMS